MTAQQCEVVRSVISKASSGISQSDLRKFMYCFLKISPELHKWKKLTGRTKQRYLTLRQLVFSEEKYTEDLLMIIAKIKQPLCEKGFLAGESEKLVFVNIESMVALSKQFSADMRPLFESFDSHTTIIGPTLTALFNGFVIYGAFMVEYSNSFKTLNELLTLPEVKAIEEAISPQTFSLCIGKIQSRPYKYKATLEQYLKYLPKNHPDYASMGKAISKHNSVMSKCNMGMEQHEGQNRLIELDRMFGNIIGLQIRQFVGEYQAIAIDINCKLYLLSDMLLVARTNSKAQLLCKLYLDTSCVVSREQDTKHFTNRLRLCSRDRCIHLLFAIDIERDRAYTDIERVIKMICSKEDERREIILKTDPSRKTAERGSSRFSRFSARFSDTRNNSETELIRSSAKQMKRRPIITVVGHDKRFYGDCPTVFYVIKIQLQRSNQINQLCYVDADTILLLEKIIRHTSPEISCRGICDRPNGLTYDDTINDEIKTLQFRSIFVQELLNAAFRGNLVQKVDAISHHLKLAQAMWTYLTDDREYCTCNACIDGRLLLTIEEYFEQCQKRRVAHLLGMHQFCVYKSFDAQNRLGSLDSQSFEAHTLQQKLLWLSCRQGRINYRYLSRLNPGEKKHFELHLPSLQKFDSIRVQYYKDDPVGVLLDTISKNLNFKIYRDMTLVAKIGDNMFFLDQDELIDDVLAREEKQQSSGFFGSLKNKILDIQVKSVVIYLRKLYVFDEQEELQACQVNPAREQFIFKEITYRVKTGEMQLNLFDYHMISAFYYAIKQFHALKETNQRNMQWTILENLMPERIRVDQKFVDDVYILLRKLISERITETRSKIYRATLSFAMNKTGWNAFMYTMQRIAPLNDQLLVGVSLNGIIIQIKSEWAPTMTYKRSQIKYSISSFQLTLQTPNQVLHLRGKSALQIHRLLQFYTAYSRYFIDKTGQLDSNSRLTLS